MGKKLAIIGLSAGLLGGGAAGLAFTGTTGIAGAQDATSTTVAADTPADASTGTADADRPDPSTKLAEALAPLVTDGTLTQAQADKVVETLKAAGPMGGGHGPGRDGGGRGRGRRGVRGAAVVAPARGAREEEDREEQRAGVRHRGTVSPGPTGRNARRGAALGGLVASPPTAPSRSTAPRSPRGSGRRFRSPRRRRRAPL